MGSKVGKVLLPLVAIGVAGAMTGGFGLLGGGAAGGAATGGSAAGATAGASVGSSVAGGLTSTAAAGGLTSAAVETAALPMIGEAGAVAGLDTMASANLVAESTMMALESGAATPWWQSAWSWMGANKDIIGLGISGVSSGVSGIGAYNQAAANESMLKLQAAEDGLALAERERDSQLKLSQVLATQNNMFAARGVNVSEGSALQAQQSAKSQADRELSLYGLYSGMQQSAYSQRRRMAARAKSGAPVGALLDFGASAYDVWRG